MLYSTTYFLGPLFILEQNKRPSYLSESFHPVVYIALDALLFLLQPPKQGSWLLGNHTHTHTHTHTQIYIYIYTHIHSGFFVIKPTKCTNFTYLFCHETLHVSDSSSVHHQEFIRCALSNSICHTGL
jgi:hypothetical protein